MGVDVREMSITAQRARASEIEAIAKQRRLTKAELDEYDSLAHRSYMRNWRMQQNERWGRNKFDSSWRKQGGGE
jgi:hypothetical protein